jgi:hypothetical protein
MKFRVGIATTVGMMDSPAKPKTKLKVDLWHCQQLGKPSTTTTHSATRAFTFSKCSPMVMAGPQAIITSPFSLSFIGPRSTLKIGSSKYAERICRGKGDKGDLPWADVCFNLSSLYRCWRTYMIPLIHRKLGPLKMWPHAYPRLPRRLPHTGRFEGRVGFFFRAAFVGWCWRSSGLFQPEAIKESILRFVQ